MLPICLLGTREAMKECRPLMKISANSRSWLPSGYHVASVLVLLHVTGSFTSHVAQPTISCVSSSVTLVKFR
jgi:hypothetical protein